MIDKQKAEFHIQETIKHKNKVKDYLLLVSKILEKRGREHDNSKLENSENEIFAVYTNKLKTCSYGSEEYKQYLLEMKPALNHHYQNNRHHPEHFANGIKDMNLIDIIEMLFDWLAASKRHDSGNIMKSIDLNMERFNYDENLSQIFKNTLEYMSGYGMEVVETIYLPDDNDNVKSIVHDWMTGKCINMEEYGKIYTEDELDRANSTILTLCSMGLG